MILCASTSSPLASVAILSDQGEVIAAGSGEAPRAASGAVIRLTEDALVSAGITWTDICRFVVDVGPGSFTGTKVGMTMIKLWAHSRGCLVAGVSSFDLVDAAANVAIPQNKSDVVVRVAGEQGVVRKYSEVDFPVRGYSKLSDPEYPLASNVQKVFAKLNWVETQNLLPQYIAEPNISLPKNPLIMGGGSG